MRGRQTVAAAVLTAAALVAGTIGAAQPARAITLKEAQAQLKALQQRLANDKAVLAQTQTSLAQKRQTIVAMHQSLDSTTKQLDQALNWEATLTRRLTHKQQEIATTRRQLSHDQATLSGALVAIEQEGPGGYLNVVFGAQSFSDFEARIGLLSQIISADVAVLGDVQRAETSLEQEQNALVSARRQYAAAADVQRQAKSALSQQIAYQRDAIAALDETYAQQQTAVHSDEGSSAEIEQIIQSLASHGTGSGINGIHFIWPVVGPITSPFGYRVDPVTHQYALHTGIDIGVPMGTPIHAAASGKVIVAQWLNGYGYTIIIDDGGGIANLYAHQERSAVSVGQEVQQGQVIGYAGMTGWATGPHVHFEVRINGKPVNPAPYMPPMP